MDEISFVMYEIDDFNFYGVQIYLRSKCDC